MLESMNYFINYKTYFLTISYDKIMYNLIEMQPIHKRLKNISTDLKVKKITKIGVNLIFFFSFMAYITKM